MSGLTDKTIVVTGASSGIGRVLALQLADAGATVIATARSADKLVELGQADARIIGVPIDVGDAGSVRRFAEWALTRFTRIDAVVNNAGIGYLEPFVSSSPEHWRETIEINLFGALRTMQAFLPGMLQHRRGLIVNVGSNGASGWPYLTLYAASKAALESATIAIDREYSERGVRILSVDVGPTRGTEFGSRFTDADALAEATSAWTRLGIPWNDFATADETAGRIVRLLDEQLRALTEGNGHT